MVTGAEGLDLSEAETSDTLLEWLTVSDHSSKISSDRSSKMSSEVDDAYVSGTTRMHLAHVKQIPCHVLANAWKSNVNFHIHFKFCMPFLFSAANAVGGAADLKDLKDNFLLVCDSLGEQVRS